MSDIQVQNKDLIRRYMEVDVNQGDIVATAKLLADDFAFHFPGAPMPLDGAGLAGTTQAFHLGFPDQHTTVDEIIAEGDRVAARFTFHGTQTGEFQGIPPTGKNATMSGMAFWRIADGKIAEHWVAIDALGMLQQLGVIPAPQPA